MLCRRQKNNPLFVGEAGVGKTAIAEGLAKRIVDSEVPEVLSAATVFSLDMGTLLAGTRYRGDLHKFSSGHVGAGDPLAFPAGWHFHAALPSERTQGVPSI